MYTKCIRHFDKFFVYKIKRTMPAKFSIQNILYTKSEELCQLNFVCKINTKVCRNVGYILYTDILYTFCINQF